MGTVDSDSKETSVRSVGDSVPSDATIIPSSTMCSVTTCFSFVCVIVCDSSCITVCSSCSCWHSTCVTVCSCSCSLLLSITVCDSFRVSTKPCRRTAGRFKVKVSHIHSQICIRQGFHSLVDRCYRGLPKVKTSRGHSSEADGQKPTDEKNLSSLQHTLRWIQYCFRRSDYVGCGFDHGNRFLNASLRFNFYNAALLQGWATFNKEKIIKIWNVWFL